MNSIREGDDEPVKLNAGDVIIEPLEPRECDDCVDPATKLVMLDLRGNGMAIAVGKFCDVCADETAERLRTSLPAATE